MTAIEPSSPAGASERLAAAEAESRRLLEAEDPDRAVSVLFAPAERRRDLTALYAFNIETARVRDQVSQPLPGEIRLQWWRDRIAAIEGPEAERGGQGHPVAESLLATIARRSLPPDAFERFLDGRILDLYDDPMPSRQEFEAYAGETASTLIMLAAMILDRNKAGQAADAAGHAGVAQAAAGILRLLPLHRARGQIYVPADILSAVGCSGGELLSGDREASARAVAAMAAFAREHFSRYRAVRRGLPASLRPAFLAADLTDAYLSAIEKRGLAAIEEATPIGPLRRTITYWRSMRR